MKKTASKQADKREQRPLVGSIRKQPVAPPGHPLAHAKPEERAHPAERKVKHKRRPGDSE